MYSSAYVTALFKWIMKLDALALSDTVWTVALQKKLNYNKLKLQ